MTQDDVDTLHHFPRPEATERKNKHTPALYQRVIFFFRHIFILLSHFDSSRALEPAVIFNYLSLVANHRKPFISIFHIAATAAAHFCFLSHQAELKSKKAAESFALCIEKYNRVGGEFEQKMSESSQVSSFPSGQNRKPLSACVTAFVMTLSSLLSTLPPDKCANVLLFVLYKKTKKKTPR